MMYLVRQYRPAYFSGFENNVVTVDNLDVVPWLNEADDIEYYEVAPYGDEIMISVKYKDGQQLVVAFALPANSQVMAPDGGLLRNNWRYCRHIQE